ncbi:hypothetical protein XELAEV_18039917mg [Xenopus laevis]|uniref:Uncharacterized protein n=1 Tax=Xenopus laevis TaxID=8355 RepID=A0A974C9J6_XENLA|nr:hypothetical protein XELAEV_18039917mg [Xenopus laevis]
MIWSVRYPIYIRVGPCRWQCQQFGVVSLVSVKSFSFWYNQMIARQTIILRGTGDHVVCLLIYTIILYT